MGFLLDDLCRPYEIVTLPNGKNVRVRALSDAELRARDLEATRVSAVMMERLRDPNSREYQSIVLPVLQGDAAVMRQALLAYRSVEAAREVQIEIQPEFIPFPDNASEEEKREVMLRREAQNKEIAEKRAARIAALVEKEKAALSEMDEDKLRDLVSRRSVNGVSDSIWSDEFVIQTIYLSCEVEDGSGRYFVSPDQARGLPRTVRSLLWNKYAEADRIDPFSFASPSPTESLTD